MSWEALGRLGLTLRPYDDPPPSGERPAPFSGSLQSTLKILERELDFLAATKIVLQVGYHDRDLRLDGLPRANARLNHDAVALSFDSRWGPLRYQTNEFVARYYRSGGDGWQANLRAVALAMEALRKVDRYGVSKRGEQYTGWRQIPERSSAPADLIETPEQAREYLSHFGGSFTEAAKRLHPDHGGDPAKFHAAVKARDILARR